MNEKWVHGAANPDVEMSMVLFSINQKDCILTFVGSLNFSLGYAKLVTPKGKNQYTLRKL